MRLGQQQTRVRVGLSALLLVLCSSSTPTLPQSFDPLDLFRQIRAARKAVKDLSKPIRLRDDSNGRSAQMRLMHQGPNEYVLFLLLSGGKKLHPHTLYLKTDTQHISLKPIPERQTTNPTKEEVVGAVISVAQLELLAAAKSLEIRVGGFGESLRDQVNEKDLVKIRKFCERYGIVKH